jgi:hypothetical protein
VKAPILDPRAPAAAVPHSRVLGAPPRRTAGAKRGSESGARPTNRINRAAVLAPDTHRRRPAIRPGLGFWGRGLGSGGRMDGKQQEWSI